MSMKYNTTNRCKKCKKLFKKAYLNSDRICLDCSGATKEDRKKARLEHIRSKAEELKEIVNNDHEDDIDFVPEEIMYTLYVNEDDYMGDLLYLESLNIKAIEEEEEEKCY